VNAVSQLNREWSSIASGSIAEPFSRWRRRKPPLRRFESPTALLRFLQSSDAPESDEPLLALLELAAEDRLAGRFVLQALLPALGTVSRQIVHPPKRRRELWELLLFFTWEAICRHPAEARRCIAADLALQVLDDTTRELRRAEQPLAPAALRDGRPLPAEAA
jgi:hypothetical protein